MAAPHDADRAAGDPRDPANGPNPESAKPAGAELPSTEDARPDRFNTRSGLRTPWDTDDSNRPHDTAETADRADDTYLRLAEVGRCTLQARIGRGGMGVVYKGWHRDLDIDVAVKFLHPHLTREAGTTDRFLREARLAARLQCTGIVRVFTCGE